MGACIYRGRAERAWWGCLCEQRGLESDWIVVESGMVGVYDLGRRSIDCRGMSFKSLGCEH